MPTRTSYDPIDVMSVMLAELESERNIKDLPLQLAQIVWESEDETLRNIFGLRRRPTKIIPRGRVIDDELIALQLGGGVKTFSTGRYQVSPHLSGWVPKEIYEKFDSEDLEKIRELGRKIQYD